MRERQIGPKVRPNQHWDDLDGEPSEEGIRFASHYVGVSLDKRCHAIQALAVYFDKWKMQNEID
jgi:hypothetical protein